MAEVNDVEAAVGEDDLAAGRPVAGQFGVELIESPLLAGPLMGFDLKVAHDLVGGDGDAAQLLDLPGLRRCCQARPASTQLAPAAAGDADHGQDHVAGAGGVEHLARVGLEQPAALAIARGQIAALLVECDDDGFKLELVQQALGRELIVLADADWKARRPLGLGAVELEGRWRRCIWSIPRGWPGR